MTRHDVVVIGGGVSGPLLRLPRGAGRAVRPRCSSGRRSPAGVSRLDGPPGGYWFELGAHTCYNSYVSFLELVEACGFRGELLRRAPTKLRFLDGDRLVPGANLGVLLRLFS